MLHFFGVRTTLRDLQCGRCNAIGTHLLRFWGWEVSSENFVIYNTITLIRACIYEIFVKISTRKNLPNFTKTNMIFKCVWLLFISASKIKQNNSNCAIPPKSYLLKNKTLLLSSPWSIALWDMLLTNIGVIVPCFAHQYSKRYVMDIIVYWKANWIPLYTYIHTLTLT
jgi:hypothetical protein